MSEIGDAATPRFEVRILRDGIVVQRELVESEEEANAVIEAWSDVDGVVCQVEDLVRDRAAAGVLDPRPWEVDADDAYDGSAYEDDER